MNTTSLAYTNDGDDIKVPCTAEHQKRRRPFFNFPHSMTLATEEDRMTGNDVFSLSLMWPHSTRIEQERA